VDYFKAEMSEYDANYVFVPMASSSTAETMENRVTSIQIRLKNTTRMNRRVAAWGGWFAASLPGGRPGEEARPLLSAIAVEKGIRNVLWF